MGERRDLPAAFVCADDRSDHLHHDVSSNNLEHRPPVFRSLSQRVWGRCEALRQRLEGVGLEDKTKVSLICFSPSLELLRATFVWSLCAEAVECGEAVP